MPTKIPKLEQACAESDTAKVSKITHSLKGIFFAMRCNLLAEIANKMESDARNNSLENMDTLLTELKAEWEVVKKLLLQKME
jgi:HPt (histidine-containing phosphotransfer) domain-containing protein